MIEVKVTLPKQGKAYDVIVMNAIRMMDGNKIVIYMKYILAN